jgi:hypothetical protein
MLVVGTSLEVFSAYRYLGVSPVFCLLKCAWWWQVCGQSHENRQYSFSNS